MTDTGTEGRGNTPAALPRRESALPNADRWNAALEHSLANPTHILGPYHDDDGQVQMDCTGDGDPYEPNCDFDTANLENSDGP